MAEIIQRDGTWAFDGSTVRIAPGPHRGVPLFRRTYGEIEEFARTKAAVLRGS
jgi:hypothetical protein